MVNWTIYFEESSLLILLYFLAVAAVTLIWGFLLYNVFREVFKEGARSAKANKTQKEDKK